MRVQLDLKEREYQLAGIESGHSGRSLFGRVDRRLAQHDHPTIRNWGLRGHAPISITGLT